MGKKPKMALRRDEAPDCSALRGRIADLVLGEVSGADEAFLRGHLGVCPACRRLFQDYARVWNSLSLARPPRFSARPLRIAAALPRRRPVRFRVPAWTAAAAAVVLGGIIWFGLRARSGVRDGMSVSALTASEPGEGELRPREVLLEYLASAEAILGGIEEGKYPTWRALSLEILRGDLQGRGAYLLESLPPASPQVEIVRRLRGAFAELLKTGRGREIDPVSLPPGWGTASLRTEIRELLRRQEECP